MVSPHGTRDTQKGLTDPSGNKPTSLRQFRTSFVHPSFTHLTSGLASTPAPSTVASSANNRSLFNHLKRWRKIPGVAHPRELPSNHQCFRHSTGFRTTSSMGLLIRPPCTRRSKISLTPSTTQNSRIPGSEPSNAPFLLISPTRHGH